MLPSPVPILGGYLLTYYYTLYFDFSRGADKKTKTTTPLVKVTAPNQTESVEPSGSSESRSKSEPDIMHLTPGTYPYTFFYVNCQQKPFQRHSFFIKYGLFCFG